MVTEVNERVLRLSEPKMTGVDVRWLQNKLCHRGYWMKRDGVFGETTMRLLASFQSAHGLKANGVLDWETLELLKAR
jgi:N-acetyl-anhydromuramyl-L-alanine amidase AmpD